MVHQTGAERERPLADVVVLDLSDEATVFGARLLAEQGANVVRVEDAAGDSIRSREPFLKEEPGTERSLAHLLYNAGKRSCALDLGSAEAWEVVRRLAVATDVVIGPLRRRPEVLALFDTLSAQGDQAPGMVEVVFRRGAPEEVATDLITTAAGGLLTLNGFPEDPPNYPAGELGYKEGSLAAAEAAVALVLEQRRSGRSGRVTVSLQEAVNLTTVQTANANFYKWHGQIPSRHTPIASGITFQSRDGKWTSFTIHPPNWPRFVDWVEELLGTTELRDPEWDDQTLRAARRGEVAALTQALCQGLDQDELIREGQSRGLLVLPVNSVVEIATDPHLVERGFVEEVWHPQFDAPVRLPRTSFLTDAHQSTGHPAPTLGQNTEAVLRDVGGLERSEIDALFSRGIAHGPREETPRLEAAGDAALPGRQRPQGMPTRPVTPSGVPHQPLKGVRIVDFCWAIAGPLGTRLLADLGADVIKVESEYRLDPIRYIGVQPEGEMSWNTNGQFNDCNPNKRALTLNLNTPEGIDAIRKLVATADIVTSNYTPDRLDLWGLGYEALREIRPDLIMANLAVMGLRGPHKGWRSYGSGIVAMCGLADLTGFPGRDPIGLGTLHTDFTVPYFAAMHVLAALVERDRTGAGQYLELSQYEASVHLLDTELVEHLNNGTAPARRGNRSARLVPHGVYPCAGDDGWVAIACRDDDDWHRFCALADFEGAWSLGERQEHIDAVESAVAAWTETREKWAAAAELQGVGVPASPVEDLSELLGRDEGMASDFHALELPGGLTVYVQEEPIVWDGQRLPLTRAPQWGEHTQEILSADLGLDAEAISDLAAKNVLY